MSLFGFPDAALAGMLKRAALHLPPQHRSALLAKLSKGGKGSDVLSNARKFVVCLLSARNSTDEQFASDLAEAYSGTRLSPCERELFLGWLGGRLAMALAEAKKGVNKSRLDALREAIVLAGAAQDGQEN